MALRLALAVSFALVLAAPPALATYSIVGADTATREVGGTGTSCLNGSDVYIIYGAAPGFGAIHAQAQANQNGRDRGVELLMQGTAPADVIAAITAAGFDTNSRVRQYGVVDATGRTAGFTGAGDQAFADDRQGTSGTFSYSVQGNILTSEAVLTQASAAFEGLGCDLAERLMRALEAGAENGEGDSRCTPDGIPSDSSFIQVERPELPKGGYLELHVRSSGSQSPIPPLRALFDDWRSTHPCPSTPGGGSGGGAGMAGQGGSPGGAGGMAGSPASGAGGAAGAPASGTGGTTAPGGAGPAGATSGGSGGGGGQTKPASDDASGCGCRAGARRGNGVLVLLFGVALVALRLGRRQRKTGV